MVSLNYSREFGEAGIWRKAAMDDAGGWNGRTTVEDMDLSLRAYLKGWRGVFLDDCTMPSEVRSCRECQISPVLMPFVHSVLRLCYSRCMQRQHKT